MNVLNVLIADDHFVIRRLLSEYLKPYKQEVKIFFAEDGEEAMTILSNEKIDLALLDIIMPKKSGIEVLEYMEAKGMNDIPIIVFSTDEAHKIEAFDKGAHSFLAKPVSEDLLISTISQYLDLEE